MKPSMNVAIIGRGAFGRAIGSVLHHNNIDFEYGEVSRLLTQPADVLFIMVPTQAIREALTDNAQMIHKGTIIVNGSKGIEEQTHMLPHQIVADLGLDVAYHSLLGPSFAHGVVAQHPTLLSLGYDQPDHVQTLQKLLQSDYFRLHPIHGCDMLELAAAFKNLYAILCGYAKGLGYGANTRAALIMLAIQEFTDLAHALGYAEYDVVSPGVLGDMVLTCSSKQSRNFQFGVELAKSTDQAALMAMAQTTEGYHTAHSVASVVKRTGKPLPLAELTARMTREGYVGADAFRAFLARA
jgi:glycerol-3-phosphate dehydrogenase (NAD(P)+)